MKSKLCIYGTGGCAKDVLCVVVDSYKVKQIPVENNVIFSVDDAYYNESEIMGVPVIPYSKLDHEQYKFIVAIGDPQIRQKKVESLPEHTEYATIVHPSAIVSNWVSIGEGTIITAGCVITCQIKLGKHVQLNLNTTVAHDCIIGNYCTIAPGVAISGNCTIGDRVYIGTNAGIREKLDICSDVTIGMGAVVLKPIKEKGVYFGNPAKSKKNTK